mmetsp:Transcript_25020/g.34841  ORF Transcript_25020/g.34841 Transcript_25020/m.34841 type:complete len:434 (-) Transcript_25020:326-1627(-)|eukprot:CAMPEP_0184480002 /NCGR_PEP_ID=MMETSP0113_2-20130426/1499_1 /TAXON_ID=91329 /ORGANISM="Norrisiella sphaerica, Strain BC52" /LENGTH=433 /DNA_ID=CAMNT_0026858187 /DNA_START=168 /DNA_END=1472 /DNA_ORIENTATION=-
MEIASILLDLRFGTKGKLQVDKKKKRRKPEPKQRSLTSRKKSVKPKTTKSVNPTRKRENSSLTSPMEYKTPRVEAGNFNPSKKPRLEILPNVKNLPEAAAKKAEVCNVLKKMKKPRKKKPTGPKALFVEKVSPKSIPTLSNETKIPLLEKAKVFCPTETKKKKNRPFVNSEKKKTTDHSLSQRLHHEALRPKAADLTDFPKETRRRQLADVASETDIAWREEAYENKKSYHPVEDAALYEKEIHNPYEDNKYSPVDVNRFSPSSQSSPMVGSKDPTQHPAHENPFSSYAFPNGQQIEEDIHPSVESRNIYLNVRPVRPHYQYGMGSQFIAHPDNYSAGPPVNSGFPVSSRARKSFKCPECPWVFESRSLLVRHVQNTHAGGFHGCPHCHEQFPAREYLLAHMQYCTQGGDVPVHSKPYPYAHQYGAEYTDCAF